MNHHPVDVSIRRRLLKNPVTKRLRRSRVGVVGDALVIRRRAGRWAPEQLASLQEVATVCLLIGHVKSGGSLVGAMLDAHPEIAMGDEVDLKRLIRSGISGDAMLMEFMRSARREAVNGRVTARRLGGYSLQIGGWSQGSSDRPRVIGDSRAGPTTRYLAEEAGALPALFDTFEGRRIAFLHVIRRPQDSIAAMVLRSGRDVVAAANDHARQCQRLAALRARLGDSVLSVRYESLVDDCEGTMARVLEFLEVKPLPGYLRACADLIDEGRTPESARVSWRQPAADVVDTSIRRFDFLAPYRA